MQFALLGYYLGLNELIIKTSHVWLEICYFWFLTTMLRFNTLRPRRNGRHFPDDILKCIFLNENVWIPIEISLKFVRKGPVDNIPALVYLMAWHRPGDKPLSEPMMISLPMHICVTRPQWVKWWLSLSLNCQHCTESTLVDEEAYIRILPLTCVSYRVYFLLRLTKCFAVRACMICF